MDDKHFDDYADTLPTFDDDEKPASKPTPEPEPKSPTITTHKMLDDREDDEPDEEEEKASIDRKTVYDDTEKQEHFFSKAKIEASSDFEKEMLKKKELEEEKRAELHEKEIRAKKARLLRELKEEQKAGMVDYEKLALIAELESESTKSKVEGKTNDLANQLNSAISHNIHNDTTTPSETEKSIHNGIMGAIAVEIVLFFVFVPNEVFLFPSYIRFALAAISIMLALVSVIVLFVTGNMAENHFMPKNQQKLFFAASIVPGAILRVALGTFIAYLLNFIPVAGNYIGFSLGVAAGAAMHYGFLKRYHIMLGQATSLINSAAAIVCFIVPNLISGTINQPMDQKSQFGYAIYIIEGVFTIVVDIIIYSLFTLKQNRR